MDCSRRSDVSLLTVSRSTATRHRTTGYVAVRSSTFNSATTAAAAITLAMPAGVANGDVLIAQLNSDNAPAMSSTPTGWTALLSAPLVINSAASAYAYYHIVTNASSEPSSLTWTLDSAQKHRGCVT